MKNRTRKKHLAEHAARARKLPVQFVRDTLHAKAEAKAGKLAPYQFTQENRPRPSWPSLAELPKADADFLHERQSVIAPVGVRVIAQPGKIIAETTDSKPTLDEMLASFNKKKHGDEVMAFAPIGKEVL